MVNNSHPSITPYGTYEVKNNHYIMICCGTDKNFYSLCEILGLHENLYLSEKFKNNKNRV